jgi:hypothetical protein
MWLLLKVLTWKTPISEYITQGCWVTIGTLLATVYVTRRVSFLTPSKHPIRIWCRVCQLCTSHIWGQSVPVRSRERVKVAGPRWEEVSDTNLISGQECQTWGRLGRETPARDGKNHSAWRRKYPIIQFYLLERDADAVWDLCCTRKETITHHKSIG